MDFELPDPQNFKRNEWGRIVDTSLSSPEDIVLLEDAKKVEEQKYSVKARSIVLLTAI